MEHDILGRFNENIPGATEHLKWCPDGILQTAIRVPFLQSHL